MSNFTIQYDITLTHDMRWDQLSMLWFDSFDFVQDIKEANPHITLADKEKFYVLIGTGLFKPVFSEEKESIIGGRSWRQ